MLKKSFLSVSLALCALTAARAQDHSDLDVTVNKFQTLYNNEASKDIFNMFSDRIKTLMPQEQTTQTMTQLHQQLGDMKGYSFVKQEQGISFYKADFEKSSMTMAISQNSDKKLESFRFMPWQDEQDKDKVSDLVYKSPAGKIYGTFSMPETDKRVPVVLIIAGSGPTDRNGNQTLSVKGDTYKMLADSLKKASIASVRYDKRGIGESSGALKNEADMRFEDMVNDAAGIAAMLKTDKRFSSVIILGHSEGSLVGMLAAIKEPVNAYISVSGLANSADKILIRQIAAQSEELSLKAAFMLDSMNKGKKIENTDPELATLFRPSVQPYLRSWMKYEPRTEIQKLNIPVLIVQGTTDIQVSEGEAVTLKEAYPKATLSVIKDMNHVLKKAPMDRKQNMATYTEPKLPLAPGLMSAITAFISASTRS
ncbi:hypothetical protein GCM10023093_05170 [Nemorincola caseinilytica]|uniref:Serine aminopeptidase S33 domain-containing protein n=1 Tax=Nemorincola caseinilytica TaxID=2054315 RepID=A0ABP8N776_9BACT